MTDRSLPLRGPMIRALLDGRKTQHRVPLKPQPEAWAEAVEIAPYVSCDGSYGRKGSLIQRTLDDYRQHGCGRLPYAPGDRLWVREGLRFIAGTGSHNWDGAYNYRADGAVKYGRMYSADEWGDIDPANKWRSPIHMPRWASRLTLIVTDVRVQRVQEITEADAVAEGVGLSRTVRIPAIDEDFHGVECVMDGTICTDHRDAMRHAWHVIHGPGAWAANPWVCALTFTVHHKNIAEVQA